ncbi:hypothetical protein J7643_08810 [bacterium]|nr:hypothetical protein [bacterium]
MKEKRAAIYIRILEDPCPGGIRHDWLHQARLRCETYGWQLVGEYDDTRTDDNRALAHLKQAIACGAIDVVVVRKPADMGGDGLLLLAERSIELEAIRMPFMN